MDYEKFKPRDIVWFLDTNAKDKFICGKVLDISEGCARIVAYFSTSPEGVGSTPMYFKEMTAQTPLFELFSEIRSYWKNEGRHKNTRIRNNDLSKEE